MQANPARYENMEYRRCGQSGLLLPAISLGLWHNFGDSCPFDNMENLCWTAFDQGITCFDLANNYGPEPGAAETNFGKILKRGLGKYRDELIITTKAGYDMWPGPYGNWGSRKHLLASLDQSLKRMDLDYVDIFYHHRPDPGTPMEETALALADIVRQGKALYIGLSRYDGVQMQKMKGLLDALHTPCIINQDRYSLLDRTPEENGVLQETTRLNMGLTTFSPLAQGQLSDKYLHGIPADSRMAVDGRYLKKAALSDAKISALHRLDQLARENGYTLAELAIVWLLAKPEVTSVLIGASKPAQILANVKAASMSAPDSRLTAQIDQILAGLDLHGSDGR